MSIEAAANVDVVVIGAGPIGLTMTNLLGIYGVQTLLIEKNASTVSEPRAVSIDDESLRVMQTIGLDKQVCSNLLPGYGSSYLSPRGREFAFVHPKTEEYGFPRRNAFNQDVLEAQLRNGLERFPNVEELFEHRLEQFHESPDGVQIAVTASGGERKTISCRYLLACDGASSTVRGQLGMALEGKSYSEKWLIIDILNSADPYRHTKVFCDPKRPGLALPGPKRTRRFEFMLLAHDDEDEIVSEKSVRHLLKSHGPDEHAEIRRRTIYAFHARMAPTWKVGRISLHGDAAHITPPFAGQGMNSGIRDAFNYAWKVACVVKGQMPERVLESYQEERKDHAAALIKMAQDMGKVMMPKRTLGAFFTRTGFRLLRLCPPAYDYISQMKYKPKPKFHSGLIVPDEKPAKKSVVGCMFPQPRISYPDESTGPLDEFLGTGFSLLVFSSDPDALLDTVREDAFGALSVRRVCITPSDIRFTASRHDVEFARDMDADIEKFLRLYGECAVLLRPDRYVAAVFQQANAAKMLDAWQKTFGIMPPKQSASSSRTKLRPMMPIKDTEQSISVNDAQMANLVSDPEGKST